MTTDGYRLYHEVHGEGDTPLLVHPGLLSAASSAPRFMAPLIEHERLVVYDHIGSGQSDRPTPDERSYSTARQLDDALELRAHLGIETHVAMGWARGGATAVRHAVATPDDVKAIVMLGLPLVRELVEATPSGVASAFRELATKGEGLAPRAFIDAGIPDATREQKELAVELLGGSTPPDVLAAQLEADFGAVSLTDARAVACPVLMVWGTGDILVPQDHVHALADALPHSTLVPIEGAGQGVFFTRPEETFAAVRDFLA